MQRSAHGRPTGHRVDWNRYEARSTLGIPHTRQLMSNQHMSTQKKINKCRFCPREYPYESILNSGNGPASPKRDRNDGSAHSAQPPDANGFTRKVIEK